MSRTSTSELFVAVLEGLEEHVLAGIPGCDCFIDPDSESSFGCVMLVRHPDVDLPIMVAAEPDHVAVFVKTVEHRLEYDDPALAENVVASVKAMLVMTPAVSWLPEPHAP